MMWSTRDMLITLAGWRRTRKFRQSNLPDPSKPNWNCRSNDKLGDERPSLHNFRPRLDCCRKLSLLTGFFCLLQRELQLKLTAERSRNVSGQSSQFTFLSAAIRAVLVLTITAMKTRLNFIFWMNFVCRWTLLRAMLHGNGYLVTPFYFNPENWFTFSAFQILVWLRITWISLEEWITMKISLKYYCIAALSSATGARYSGSCYRAMSQVIQLLSVTTSANTHSTDGDRRFSIKSNRLNWNAIHEKHKRNIDDRIKINIRCDQRMSCCCFFDIPRSPNRPAANSPFRHWIRVGSSPRYCFLDSLIAIQHCVISLRHKQCH